jgi:hypothetical protein
MLDLIIAVLLLTAVAAPVAILARWFVDFGYEDLGSLVGGADRNSWSPEAMPWPRGVQEEDGVRWHVRNGDAAMDSGPRPGATTTAKRRPLAALQDHITSVAAGQPARTDSRKALS